MRNYLSLLTKSKNSSCVITNPSDVITIIVLISFMFKNLLVLSHNRSCNFRELIFTEKKEKRVRYVFPRFATHRRSHLTIYLSDVHLYSLLIKRDVISAKAKRKGPVVMTEPFIFYLEPCFLSMSI